MHWLMTPGRQDIFGFLIGSDGFLFPWPRPQEISDPRSRARLRLEESEKPVRLNSYPLAQNAVDRMEPSDSRAVERFDAEVLAHRQMAFPDNVDHQWRSLHERIPSLLIHPPKDLRQYHPASERRVAPEPHSLSPQQRLLASAVRRGQYVIPVGVHPDLELVEGASPKLWQQFANVARVEAPHAISAWDRRHA